MENRQAERRCDICDTEIPEGTAFALAMRYEGKEIKGHLLCSRCGAMITTFVTTMCARPPGQTAVVLSAINGEPSQNANSGGNEARDEPKRIKTIKVSCETESLATVSKSGDMDARQETAQRPAGRKTAKAGRKTAKAGKEPSGKTSKPTARKTAQAKKTYTLTKGTELPDFSGIPDETKRLICRQRGESAYSWGKIAQMNNVSLIMAKAIYEHWVDEAAIKMHMRNAYVAGTIRTLKKNGWSVAEICEDVSGEHWYGTKETREAGLPRPALLGIASQVALVNRCSQGDN